MAAAVGISFIQLGALIPVLEYFTTKRMKALFLSKLGNFVGQFILIVILITASSKVTVKWRAFLRGCSGLCIGIGILGLTLKELRLKMKDDKPVTFVQKTLGLAKKDLLRNVLFWLTCVVYFFYQWGIETPQAQFTDTDMTGRLDIGENIAKALLYALSPTLGLAFGMFLAWMFKKLAYDDSSRLHVRTLKDGRMNIIFGVLMVAAATMGIGCFIAPHAVKFGYFFPFSLLFATFFAFCEGIRDDAIPQEFGWENVRIVEGLILMFVGLGGLISNEIGYETDDEKEDDWKKLFRYGGGMLLLSSIVTALVLYLKQSKTLDEIQSKIDANTVVPLRANGIQQNGNRENIRKTQQRPDGVKNQKVPRLRNTVVKQEHTVTGSVDSRPYQQPGVPSTAPNGGLQPYQQPGVPLARQSGGVHPYQQTGVSSTTLSGGLQSYQQPGVSSAGQSGGFQPYQQPGVHSTYQSGVCQPFQVQQGVSTTASSGGFQPYQQQQRVSYITMHEL
ncbi:uncharacterized protein LOC123553455 [Mercenaria mercenaria]|uniref:uncharacterized protein LOC123553455 n=1 Tax=Mercenaria mercenaria TaxID=6596 RepID=UPI00234EE237|nr:uncharacterized protein LOC123553455 [Mercenaria mercenaria]